MARAPTASTSALAPTATPPTPLVLDRYRLRRRLGAGAFGTVWLAHDERLAREVAVKEVPFGQHGAGEAARAGREALAAARLSHPGIVMLYEAGADEDRAYLVSELVRGATLEALLRRGDLSDRDVLRIGIVLCDALAHAHAQGVVHRDVKPSNVMIPEHPERGTGVAKLTDFGVARVAGGEVITRTGDVVGTLAYMAPEQAEGRPVTGSADLYALALVLYEGLTGTNPVRAAGAAATARRLGRPIPPLTGRRRDLPFELGGAIDRALRPAPEERGGLGDLREELAAALLEVSDEGGTIAPSPLERDHTPGPLGRLGSRAAPGLAAGALATAVAGAFGISDSLSPLGAGAVVGATTVVLPRAGWLAAAAAGVAMTALAGDPGAALLLALALGLSPVLLWRAGRAWSVPAAAVALGAIGLAGAYPALAGQARSPRHRAALGGLGALLACLFELGSHHTEVYGRPPAAPPVHAVLATLGGAWEALMALASSAAVALVIIWVLAALVLPLLVRGRHLAVDIVLASSWAAGMASATQALGRALPGGPRHPTSSVLVLGAVAAGVFALVGARRPPPVEQESRSMARPYEEHS